LRPIDLCLLVLTLAGVPLGAWSVWSARLSRSPAWADWGRRLFVGTVVVQGAGAVLAACWRADALPPLGLTAGLLVVAMLWEGPALRRHADREGAAVGEAG
jgi:hypothetical protein